MKTRLFPLLLALLLLVGCAGGKHPTQTPPAQSSAPASSSPSSEEGEVSSTPAEVISTPEEVTSVVEEPDLPEEPETPEEPEEPVTPEEPVEPEAPIPPETPDPPAVSSGSGMKAMWLSQFDLGDIYCSGKTQRNQSDFTARMGQILDNVVSQGFNAVILQIRPYGDSMYPSDYYPMSGYAVGTTGGSISYDPVAIVVELAHQRGLDIHAWINPMRGMTDEELQQVTGNYPIRQWYDDPNTKGKYIVLHSGRWYLNPAYEPVRELIVAGAAEALAKYPFDGLHMDDYFYPTTDAAFDAAAYADHQAGGGALSLADYRRETLSTLVAALYQTAQTSGVPFGISPAGNVDTVYNDQYADVYRWCANDGYVDYICPQVYFGLEHGSHDFVKVCNTWQSMIKTDTVDLIVGMTFGKAMTGEDPWAGSGKTEWADHKDVLGRCLETTRELKKCRGIAVFCYQYFFDPLTGAPVEATAQERANFVPLLQQIGWG